MKAYEIRLLLPFVEDPQLQTSIRELALRTNLNYRTAYETCKRFFELGILSSKLHGRVRLCSLSARTESAIQALSETSHARWLQIQGTGTLSEASGGSAGHPHCDDLWVLSNTLALDHEVLSLLISWEDEEEGSSPDLNLPKTAFKLVAVAGPQRVRTVRENLVRALRETDIEPGCEVIEPADLHHHLSGKRRVCIMGHERFWRLMRVVLP